MSQRPKASLAHVQDTERDTRRFRLLALVVISASLYFLEQDDEVNLPPAAALLALFFAYTLLLGPILARLSSRLQPQNLPYLIYGMILVDAIGVTSLVHFTGGIANITVILIPLFVMYHTIYLGNSSGMASTTLFSLLYVGAAFLEDEQGNGALLVGQVGLFYLLAMFSAYLSKRTLQEVTEREMIQDLIFDAGAAHGIYLEAVTVAADVGSCVGRAPDEASLERFFASVQAMRRLASVRLSRTPLTEGAVASGESAVSLPWQCTFARTVRDTPLLPPRSSLPLPPLRSEY